MTRDELCQQTIACISLYFNLCIESFTDNRARTTGEPGTFYGHRVRLKTGKLVLEVGGANSPGEARDIFLRSLIATLGGLLAPGTPPELNRKEWLRRNVIQGGKATETHDPAGEPGHGEPA